MKLGEIVQFVHIDVRKLTDYALNPNHPHGTNKAGVFKSRLGLTLANYELLLIQIESEVLNCEAIPGKLDKRGQRYTVDIEIQGPDGQQATVRSGWLVPPGSKEASLTTLFVRKQK